MAERTEALIRWGDREAGEKRTPRPAGARPGATSRISALFAYLFFVIRLGSWRAAR